MIGAGGGEVKCVLILDSINSKGLQLAFSDLGGDDERMDADGAGGT